ncbi:MAG: TraB/GumN family protein [Aequorivita sp.]
MKHLKLFFAALVLTLTFNFSQAQEKLENSVLWKVEHADLKEPSYILGTLHIMCEKDFNIPKRVTETLQSVDALVLEIDYSDPKEMEAMQESMSNAKKISEELTEEQYNELDKLVTKITGAPLATFDAYGLSTLNAMLAPKMLPCSNFKFLDMELALRATKSKMPIFSFENVSEQTEILRKAYPTEFALEQIMLFDSYKEDFNKSIVAYKNEDLSTAVSFLTKEIYMDENATNIMQVNRNKNWVEKMPGMMKERSNLFAVGAAHLTSDYGLIHLLKEKGYTLTPVTN